MAISSSIDTEYWRRIDALLEVALAMPHAERAQWLDSLEPENQGYRDVLMAMLSRADAETHSFMDAPVGLATLEAAADELHGDKAGDIVGPYRLLRPFGTGGMGTVWYAERVDGTISRKVALKLPRAGWSPGLAARLKRECQILSALEHPGIARLYDAGLAQNGRPYLAMESIDGVSIQEYCRTHALSVDDRLRLFLEVAKAISYAHARLVVHRDIKPSNILVDGAGRVHIVDFGLAKLLDVGTAEHPVTHVNDRAMTPSYASPEQIRGEAVTVATDVYSLGMVLYELLTGQRPYQLQQASVAGLEHVIANIEIPLASNKVGPDRALARVLRGDLDNILDKALQKSVHDRYATIDAFAADVERYRNGEPVLARPRPVSYIVGKFVRRHRFTFSVAMALTAAVLVGLVATARQASIAEEQARVASLERDRAVRESRFAESAEEFMRVMLSEQSIRPLPPQELLGKAERLAEAQFRNDPLLLARVQLLLADLYGETSDFGRAEVLLESARRSAERAGDNSLLMRIRCTLGGLMGATTRREEALAMLADIPKDVGADGSAVRDVLTCYIQRSVVYRNIGQLKAALADNEAALRLIGPDQPALRINRLFLEAQRAELLSSEGRVLEAIQIFERTSAELALMGRGGTSAGLLMLNNYMVQLARAGHFAKAQEAYQRSGTASLASDAAHSALAINYARVLNELGREEDAAQLARQAAREKSRLGDRRGLAFAMLVEATAVCGSAAVKRCDELIASAGQQFGAFLPVGHSSFATLTVLAGRNWLVKGNVAEATRVLRRAKELYDAAPDKNPLRPRAMAQLALALHQQGQGEESRAMAASAVDAARQMTEGFSYSGWLGDALLVQASIEAERGDAGLARAMAVEARTNLLQGMGPETVPLRKVDALLQRLPRS